MATSVAAAVAKARREIQHEFFAADAVRPERAIAFEPRRMVQQRQFARWQAAGIIRETKPGQYWLDVTAYDRELTRRHGLMKGVILVLLLILLAALLLRPH